MLMALHVTEWKKLTSEPEIIETVTGQHIIYTAPPLKNHNVKSSGVSPKEQAIIQNTKAPQ